MLKRWWRSVGTGVRWLTKGACRRKSKYRSCEVIWKPAERGRRRRSATAIGGNAGGECFSAGVRGHIRLATFNAALLASQPAAHHRPGKAPLHESPPSSSRRSLFDVLCEANADVVALQSVHADPAHDMKPLSHLAQALHMHYAFAESWAPEFGNAVLSRWPIKSYRSHPLVDDSDWRYIAPLETFSCAYVCEVELIVLPPVQKCTSCHR